MSRTTPAVRGRTHVGTACKKCQGTERYLANDNCVRCERARATALRVAQTKRRAIQKAAGGGLYVERPACLKCGSTRYYRSSGACVDCTLRRDAARRSGIDLDTHPDWKPPVRTATPDPEPAVIEPVTLTGIRLKNRINEARRLQVRERMSVAEIAEHYSVTRNEVRTWFGGGAHV